MDLVGRIDIAARCGVSIEAVKKWLKDGNFPAPVATINKGRNPVWNWVDVEDWLEDTGRTRYLIYGRTDGGEDERSSGTGSPTPVVVDQRSEDAGGLAASGQPARQAGRNI